MISPIEEFLAGVPRGTRERLESYRKLLVEWQSHINLVGSTHALWERHFLDSAQLITMLPNLRCPIADLGTGAGFPGMVLAILGATDVHLVESNRKKIAFLREVARLTDTRVTIHAGRIETLDAGPFDVITSRALADLSTLFAYAAPLMKPGSICLFPKGKNYSIEVEHASRKWQFDLQEVRSQTEQASVILIIKHLTNKEGNDG